MYKTILFMNITQDKKSVTRTFDTHSAIVKISESNWSVTL